MANIIKRVWNQNRMVQIEDLKGMTFQAEAAGHTFQISGIDDDGNTVALTGTPSGVLLRPDNTDVALTCSVSGGVVSATLPANCYDVPGRFGLTIFITSGSSKTAIYAAVGTVTRTSSGTVAPGTSQSVVDLINAINAAVNSIPASYSSLLADIAPTYSNSALYSVGQYAWYNGDLKRCIVPITTAESYTAAHWTSAVLGQDVSDLKSALAKGYVGSQELYPQAIKGIPGVMQYRAGVMQGKKLALINGAHLITNDPTDDVYLFETGKGWITSTDTGIYLLNKSDLTYSDAISVNIAKNLKDVPSDKYYAVNRSAFDALDFDFCHDGVPNGIVKNIKDIKITNFGTSGWRLGIYNYGPNQTHKAFEPFRFKGRVIGENISRIVIYSLTGEVLRDAANIVDADDEIVVVFSSSPSSSKINLYPADDEYYNTEYIANEIASIKNGALNENSVALTKIAGVKGIYQYCIREIKQATVAPSYNAIIYDPNDSVLLFEKGLGFVVNDTSRTLLVNKTTLEVIGSATSANVIRNIATITDEQAIAVCTIGLHTLDFDFTVDGMYPYTPKDLSLLPVTGFSTYNYSSGITNYGGSIKAFAPFRLKGSVKCTGINGASYYNDDGTLGGSLSVSNGNVSADNKVVVLFSSTPDNVTFDFSSAEYEYTGKTCSVFGDSLTADAAYYPYLANLTGLVIKNCGIGGTKVSGSNANAMWQDVRINALEGDFIVIMGGTNDCNNATPGMESMDNIDTDTFIGAYNVMLSKIYYRYKISDGYYNGVTYTGVERLTNAQFPNIILMTPPPLFDNATKHRNSETFGGYVKKIANWWGLPVIDTFNNLQMNWANESYFFSSSDKTHYNTHGRAKLASIVAAKFAELYSNIDDQIS